MPNRFNSASRLHEILILASRQDAGRSNLDAWSAVFGIEEDGSRRTREVVRVLGLLHEEVDKLKAELKATDLTPERYINVVAKMEMALGLESLSTQWGNERAYLDESTLVALALLSEILPDDDSGSLDEAGLREIRTEIEPLRERIHMSASLSPTLKRYLLRQLEILSSAIRDYRIRGVRAFQDASITAMEEAMHRPPTQNSEESDNVKEVEGIWERLQKYSKRALLVHAVVITLVADANAGLDLVEKFRMLPPTSAVADHSAEPPQDSERDHPKPSTRGSKGPVQPR